MYFASDNTAPAHPAVMDAVLRANSGSAASYGGDLLTAKVTAQISDIFERECAVYFVTTGSAANGIALASVCPSYGAVLCYESSHINLDENTLPALYTGGAKLCPLRGESGLLKPEVITHYLDRLPDHPPHGAVPQALSITNVSECGTVYTPAALAELCSTAHSRGLKVHMDGARFANALAASGCSPAEATWKAGVDVLSFGGTKNGCLAAEAVVFFDPDLARATEWHRKRTGHLWSKMRYLAAQFDGYLDGGLWLELAGHANAMARRLSDGLAKLDDVQISYPTHANAVFAELPQSMSERLEAAGAVFYPWICPDDPASGRMVRLICSWTTTEAEVTRFLDVAAAA